MESCAAFLSDIKLGPPEPAMWRYVQFFWSKTTHYPIFVFLLTRARCWYNVRWPRLPLGFVREGHGVTVAQSVANIFFWTEYEYEYIRNVLFSTNTNTNIFGIIFWTEYEYEYIRITTVDRIQIFEYFWLKYSNIFCSNIRIFLVWICESYFGQTFKYSIGTDRSESLYSRNTKVTIMLLPLSKLYSVAKLNTAQSKFNPVAFAELALI